MKNEIRHFIPGECATGPNKPTFVELDRGTQNAHLLALGKEACHSCLQLPDCKRQREPIAQELADRGVTGKTVIAAEVIEIPGPQFDKDTPRRDTDFTFNLQYPLTEPRHILEIIRQGFRSRQLNIKVARTNQHKELSTDLEAILDAKKTELELSGAEITSWADTAAHLALRYRHATDRDSRTTKVMQDSQAIHYYCFYKNTSDPMGEISAWKQVVAKQAPLYKQLGIDIIKGLALTKRDEALKDELDLRVKLQNELLEEYTHSPHPGIDPDIIRRVLARPISARERLKAQEKRWEKVHAVPEIAETIAKMDTAVLRRLLILNTKRPVEAIQAYEQLQAKYREDDYIEPSMIDRAMRWGIRQAAISIKNLRFLLGKTEAVKVSLYKGQILKDGSSLPLHEKIADSTLPPWTPTLLHHKSIQRHLRARRQRC